MTARLVMLCHAPTTSLRAMAFPDDDPLDDAGIAAAKALAGRLGRASRVLVSPWQCARQTAAALGLVAEEQMALGECDYGRWRRKALEQIAADEPDAVGRWMQDPEAAPHGGESISQLVRRVGAWLDAGNLEGRILAITHASTIKAAVIHVLDAPATSFWRIDVPPLSSVNLTYDGRRWAMRVPGAMNDGPG
ncbi:MAG: Phosphoglycerate mutase [Hyphomicrobiales bacterium]|nr:Phosphoglycerate mutase [Hyphomicrobiales bacterium]